MHKRVTRRTTVTALSLLCAASLSASSVAAPRPTDHPSPATVKRSQAARILLLPPTASMGRHPKRSITARGLVVAHFRPEVRGRKVVLQARTRDGWRRMKVKRQDSHGNVQFRVKWPQAKQRDRRFRLVARKKGDHPRFVTRIVTTRSWKTSFVDEMKGRHLNLKKWNYRDLGKYRPRMDRSHSKSAKRAVRVRKGSLRLKAMDDPKRRGPWYLNGNIGTGGKFNFRYGVTTARIKFEKWAGQHGAFWLQSTRAMNGPARQHGAEIDIAEFFGSMYKKGGLSHYVWYWVNGGLKQFGGMFPRTRRALAGPHDSWWSRYHVFSVQWTPHFYVFRIDGHVTWVRRRGVSRVPEFLVLTQLVSDWEMQYLDKKKLPGVTKVDWVRVWQRR